MRVKCQSYLEFKECLKTLSEDEDLYSKTIRVSRSEQSLGPLSKKLIIQLSTVVRNSVDGSEYLLQGHEDCGNDHLDSGGDLSGSKKFDELCADLSEFCKGKWKILPGLIEL